MKRTINFSPPDISESEIQEVVKVLKSGWITTGPEVKAFEKKLADYIGVNQAVCLNSATAAEELNLRILGIGPGDEVILPAYTYTATASAVLHTGASIKLVDSQKDSVEMDYDQLESAITSRTKVIIPVDLGGVPCNYERIYQAIEDKKELFHPNNAIQNIYGRIIVCADAAHAFGSSRNGVMAGNIADFTSFSFHAVKNLTTAEGGAAVWRKNPKLDDAMLYRLYQLYSLHGQSKDALAKTKLGSWEYDVIGPWYKYNMTDLSAAIGLKQLERYPDLLARRHEIIRMYDQAMDRMGIWHLNHFGDNYQSSGNLYLIRIPGITEKQRNDFITELSRCGIAANVHYKPLPMLTAYRALGFDIAQYLNAYHLYENEITLPLHTQLSNDDVNYMIESIQTILKA
jgi:dTDP-4-amino-4,6-dideoxygalactose transaminase